MNIRLLINSIMRQTTVLIAQLSTSAGVRAPLAHIADDVFLSLSREIEAQGVGRKVAADMFGLALRGYQKKTQRLAASRTYQGKTLFEAVLEYIESEGGTSRKVLLHRFRRDGERETIGIITDLIQSGLVYSTGKGNETLYGITSDAERQLLTRASDSTALCNMVLGEVYRTPGVSAEELTKRLCVSREELEQSLHELEKEGRINRKDEDRLYANTFQIPVDSEHGWESAVFDHFQAVATGIANKLALRAQEHRASEFVGGTTLRFELSTNHPFKDDVLQLLSRFRLQTDELWQRVGEHNDAHPISDEERFNVSFYFGQNLDDPARALADATEGVDTDDRTGDYSDYNNGVHK